MSFVERAALFRPEIGHALEEMPLVVVDVGARGRLVEPWGSFAERFPKAITIIGFEPDPEECDRLNRTCEANARYLPYALWEDDRTIPVHIAERASTSSVHPPNFTLLRDYQPKHWQPRQTVKTVEVAAKPLDALLDEATQPDFIKIDTQGAELQIIRGARTVLREACFGCTLETWTAEVHAGQGLSFEIMAEMHGLGFRLGDLERVALWRRDDERLQADRGELIGMDLLYFRDLDAFAESQPAPRLIKAALIADVWGFRAMALALLDKAAARGGDHADLATLVSRTVIETSGAKRWDQDPMLNRVVDKVRTGVLGRPPVVPRIH